MASSTWVVILLWPVLMFALTVVRAADPLMVEAEAMLELNHSLTPPPQQGNASAHHCGWTGVKCDADGYVTRIQIGKRGLTGTLPSSLRNLSRLTVLEAMQNGIGGPLPDLSGMSSIQTIYLHRNNFTSISPAFFAGLVSLQSVSLDYNPFCPWSIPDTLANSSKLGFFSAVNCSLSGHIPAIFSGSNFPNLSQLDLSYNNLSGALPPAMSTLSSLQILWVNDQTGPEKLNGNISVLGNMTRLTEAWLHGNEFSGGFPAMKGLNATLQVLVLRYNNLTGAIPVELTTFSKLRTLDVSYNMLSGAVPAFNKGVIVKTEGNPNLSSPPPHSP